VGWAGLRNQVVSSCWAFSYARPSPWNAVPGILKGNHFLCLLDASYISTSHITSTLARLGGYFTVNVLYKLLTYLRT